MSNLLHHGSHHAFKGAAHIVKELKPLAAYRNPALAALSGLALGAVGVGLYLRSLKDALICLAIFAGLSVLIPGFGSIAGWGFAPAYAAYRAHTSNQNAGF